MTSIDEILTLQREFADAHGRKKISRWLLIATLGFAVADLGLAIAGQVSFSAVLREPLMLAAVAGLLHTQSTQQIRELESSLTPARH